MPPPLPWYQIAAPVAACLLLFAFGAAGNARFRFATLGVIAAVGYGILQDQVSVRLCPEYFTHFHSPINGLTDPTLLGVAWGFLGTWWAGVFLGYGAGLIATTGRLPKLSPRELIGPLIFLMLVIAAAVAISGYSVWWHSVKLGVSLDSDLKMMLPAERHQALLVVGCYHFVGYATAFVGGFVLWGWIWRERVRRGRTIYKLTES
jgi:hypothetical protein